MSDYSELKRLAEDVNEHSYEIGEASWYTADCLEHLLKSGPADAAFIAAANPATVLALIAENEALRRGMTGDYDLDAWLEFATGQIQKDAERYRWLRTKAFPDVWDISPSWNGKAPLSIKIEWANNGLIHGIKGLDCDAAIDEGMAKEKASD